MILRIPSASGGHAIRCSLSNRSATIARFGSILAAIGIRAGEALLVHSDLRDLVRLADSHELAEQSDARGFLLRSFDSALLDAVGPQGTICVLGTYSDYARFAKPFDLRQSPPDAQYGEPITAMCLSRERHCVA